MEHLPAKPAGAARERSLPLTRRLAAVEIADALHSARAGSPSRYEAQQHHADEGRRLLLDFGLARFAASAHVFDSATAMPTTPRTLTAEGTIVGTFRT